LNHITEEDLIAYQLEESVDAAAIREHLELCPECAGTAESIAETLRVFSAEPVPQANLDHAWQRLRGSLPAPVAAPRRTHVWRWLAAPALAVVVLLAFVATRHHPVAQGNLATNHRDLNPGPLTEKPRDPEMAAHFESAERLLTEVSHTPGQLDENTRRQAHDLLLSNAVYIRKANADGDLVDAAVLDKLDRTLTNLEHETAQEKADGGWHLRVQMNTDGLLFDLRILQQNDNASTKESQ